jgi:AcrR family transcriptional regulator
MGLEGLSIGALAEVTQMSKSGVFAHFGSREELQISVIREYHTRFEEEVFFPAIREPRGLPRLRALFERWIRRVSVELDSGCIYISGAVEFDDRPARCATRWSRWCGPGTRRWSAPSAGRRRRPPAGRHRRRPDAVRMHGLILALHHDARFLRNPGVLDRARTGFEPRGRDLPAPGARRTCRAAAARRRCAADRLPFLHCRPQESHHAQYNPPLRDMQFVLHELLNVTSTN